MGGSRCVEGGVRTPLIENMKNKRQLSRALWLDQGAIGVPFHALQR